MLVFSGVMALAGSVAIAYLARGEIGQALASGIICVAAGLAIWGDE